ncbi:MAG: hypothetical protein QOF64_2847, partial [Candidatus Binatota bacterium]|nr:hypothetical protein [Candidatus Binatota bacterium]
MRRAMHALVYRSHRITHQLIECSIGRNGASAGAAGKGTADVAECAACFCVNRIITVSTMSVEIRINFWFMLSS